MKHVDIDLIQLVAQRILPPHAFSRAMFEHLKATCAECRRAFKAVDEATEARLFGEGEAAIQAGVSDAPVWKSARFANQLARERRRARADLRLLLAVPPPERAGRIARARTRCLSYSFAELVIEECRRRVRSDPAEAATLADLVPEVLRRIPGLPHPSWNTVLEIRALAQAGNALRVGGDLRKSEERFTEARRRLLCDAPADTELYAEITLLEASLCSDQRRFDQAERLLDRAVSIYKHLADAINLARGLIKRGDVRRNRGDLDGATTDLTAALSLLNSPAHGTLRLFAVSNLALCFCDLGRFGEAREIVTENRSFYHRLEDRWARSRLLWLEGRIAHGLQEPREAERLLLEARNAYIGAGLAYDAAMVSLDLALLYLEERRNSDLRRIARLIEPVFRAKNIHREAAAALLLFHKAALDDSLTAALIGRVQRFLEDSRQNPKLRFRVEDDTEPECR